MISVQKRKSTCSAPASARTMAPTLSMNQPQQQQQRGEGNNAARKRSKTSGSQQTTARRSSLNQITETQHFHNHHHPQQQQQQQQHRSDEPVWIFGLINNIEQFLTTLGANEGAAGSSTKSASSTPSGSFSAAGSPAASSASCSSTLSSTSSSSSSSPASYASTGGGGSGVGSVDRLAHAGQQVVIGQQTGSVTTASLPRSPISRQIKFHEYKGPPSAKRQQVSSKPPAQQQQRQQLSQLSQVQVQQPAISSSNIGLQTSAANGQQTAATIAKSTTANQPQNIVNNSNNNNNNSNNQRLIDSNVTLAMQPTQQLELKHPQQQQQSKLPSTFNQQALTAANSQPISSAVGVSTPSTIKHQQLQRQPMDVASSSELNLAVFAQPSKQLQQQQQLQQQLLIQRNQMNFKQQQQHLARPMIGQQIQNQTHTMQQPQLRAQLSSSDQLTSVSTPSQCASLLGHTFYINQQQATVCLDGDSNGDFSPLLTPTAVCAEVVKTESQHQRALRDVFAKQHQQPVVISTTTPRHRYHNQHSATSLLSQQQQQQQSMEQLQQTAGGRATCFVRSSSNVAIDAASVELQPFDERLSMFDEELSAGYSPILSSSQQTPSLDEELNTFGPDSEDIDACEIEPSINFSHVDDLLFSEFIDLQNVPMNVDESDWLKKFLPPCSMS